MTVSEEGTWEDPETKKRVDIDGLKSLLKQEAKRVEGASNGAISLDVHVLDLRPPLPLEKEVRGK